MRDTHYGLSDALVIDGDHSDYIVNVGCIYAGEVYGAWLSGWRTARRSVLAA